MVADTGNVHREPRHIEQEQIEGGSALERAAILEERMPPEVFQEVEKVNDLLQDLRAEAGGGGLGHEPLT